MRSLKCCLLSCHSKMEHWYEKQNAGISNSSGKILSIHPVYKTVPNDTQYTVLAAPWYMNRTTVTFASFFLFVCFVKATSFF